MVPRRRGTNSPARHILSRRPLPLGGKLYAIADVKDEIRLLVLDAITGNLLWSQALAAVKLPIDQDPVRRLAGVSPSYSDGALVCPTGGGSVVAVDLATHALRWGYLYERPDMLNRNSRSGITQVQMQFMNPTGPVPRWRDGAAIISEGRVLLTPAEADMLYCLDLADGKPCWNAQRRGEHLYIACVHEGKVVLVGRNTVDAVTLKDGKDAWGGRSIELPAQVTGHGCYCGKKYLVPLSDDTVVTIDLDEGKIVATAKPHHNHTPGNLVCSKGLVISQGLDGVEVYYQLHTAERKSERLLAADPADTIGLTLRGELLLNEGKWSEAIGVLRRVFAHDEELDTHVRTQELLRDALLDGLREDFAAVHPFAVELEKLFDEPQQKAAYLRSMTIGFQRRRVGQGCRLLPEARRSSRSALRTDRHFTPRTPRPLGAGEARGASRKGRPGHGRRA